MGKKLFKSTLVVSMMTLLSRLLGFVRDMLIARIFGVDLATDAFFVAFKIPNFLRRLFTEGAFANAIVPVMTPYTKQGRESELRIFIGNTAGAIAAWSALITAIAIVAAPLMVLFLAPGFAWQDQQYTLAISLLRIMLPFGLCIVLVAYAGAILNTYDHYVVPALTPVILNLCMIASALWLAPVLDLPIIGLAWGVFAAGIIQLLFQIPSLMHLGLLPKLHFKPKDPHVRQVIDRLLPSIFSASVTQINLLLDTLVASFLVSGSVSWLYYSDRIVEFPLGILGMGLSTVILPSLARIHANDDAKAFTATIDWGLRLVILIGLPATIGLFMLAEPMLSTLFQYHEFNGSDVHQSGLSLKAYSVGLLGYLVIKILVPGFTARHDMRTPVRYGVYSMVISLLLNLVLVVPLAHAGLALATSLGALLNAGLLLWKLIKTQAFRPEKGWLFFLIRILLASALMVFCLYYFVDISWWEHWESSERVANLAKWITLAFLVYTLSLLLLGFRSKHLSTTSDKIHGF